MSTSLPENQVLDDASLVRASQIGDQTAFGLLITKHLEQIFRYVRWLTDAREAEDLTQEIFIKAWSKLPTYKSGNSFKSWLYRIAHNHAIDWLRQNKELAFSTLSEETQTSLEQIPTDEASPEFTLDRELSARELQTALAQLSPDERAVLLLRYREDLSFPEISSTLNQPLEKLKAQHYRALKKLKRVITK